MIVIQKVGSDAPAPPGGPWVMRLRWGGLLSLMVLLYGSHAPLIALSEVDGRVPFTSSSCVLLIELTKLLASLAALLLTGVPPSLGGTVAPLSWAALAPYAAPALLYAFNNNLAVHMQAHMDPSTFQLLGNLKIASTALLYSCCLRKRLRAVQWLALALLTVAGACHSYGSLEQEDPGGAEGQARPRLHVSALGLVLVLVYCLVSGVAAVYTEHVLKSRRLPLSLQNLYLYAFGVAINGAAHLWGGAVGRGLLDGFSLVVWAIVAGQAANGLLMSVVMKHGSGITRLFVISSSLLVNGALSWALLELQLTGLFALSVVMTGVAAYLYYR